MMIYILSTCVVQISQFITIIHWLFCFIHVNVIVISMRVNPIGGVMVSMFTSSAVDRGFIIISMRVNPIGVMVRVFTSSAEIMGLSSFL